MERAILERARTTLTEMRDHVLRAVQAEIDEGRSDTNDGPADVCDVASDERERMLGTLLSSREQAKLEAIGEALMLIDQGSYGVCQTCGDDIADERLEILPFTRLCVTCQAERERLERRHRRQGDSAGLDTHVGFGDAFDGPDSH